jgi:hypothetical protein
MFVPFCQSRLWNPHVYRPGFMVPMANPNVSPRVMALAMLISSSRPAGTRGLPSAPARPASFMTLTFR